MLSLGFHILLDRVERNKLSSISSSGIIQLYGQTLAQCASQSPDASVDKLDYLAAKSAWEYYYGISEDSEPFPGVDPDTIPSQLLLPATATPTITETTRTTPCSALHVAASLRLLYSPANTMKLLKIAFATKTTGAIPKGYVPNDWDQESGWPYGSVQNIMPDAFPAICGEGNKHYNELRSLVAPYIAFKYQRIDSCESSPLFTKYIIAWGEQNLKEKVSSNMDDYGLVEALDHFRLFLEHWSDFIIHKGHAEIIGKCFRIWLKDNPFPDSAQLWLPRIYTKG